MRADALRDLESSIKGCLRCELGKTRTNFVFGVGDPEARLLFVGEAPGKHEDLQGRPFVGAAGKLLDYLLSTIGLAREQVYIANVLKCRPPNNRDPLPGEIELCKRYLKEQMRIIDPVVVCTLGNFSTKLILSETRGISQLHGMVFPLAHYSVIPTYHPAAALYTPALQKKLEEDFQVVARVLDEAAGPAKAGPAKAGPARAGLEAAGVGPAGADGSAADANSAPALPRAFGSNYDAAGAATGLEEDAVDDGEGGPVAAKALNESRQLNLFPS